MHMQMQRYSEVRPDRFPRSEPVRSSELGIGVVMQIRKHLEALPPYTPIEPFDILSARIGRDPAQIVKLDANENPYGPLPAVREALGKLNFPHIYPDPESRALRKSLASFTGVNEEYLLAGAGADYGARKARRSLWARRSCAR